MKRVNAHSNLLTDWQELLDPYSRSEGEASYAVSVEALARIAQLSVTVSEVHYLQRRDGSPMDWLVAPLPLFADVPPIVACIDRCSFLEAMFFTLKRSELVGAGPYSFDHPLTAKTGAAAAVSLTAL